MNKKFNLIELVVIIAIVGLLATFIAIQLGDMTSESKKVQTEVNSKTIQMSIDLYSINSNGKYPTEYQPTETIPRPIDFSKIKNYMNSKNLPTDYKYWVDFKGNVWYSLIDAPNNVTDSETTGEVSWDSVGEATSYDIYEVENSKIEGTILSKGYKFITNISKDSEYIYRGEVGKLYVVSAIDKRGHKTAPVGKGYTGYRPPTGGTGGAGVIEEPMLEKPIAVISMTPETGMTTLTPITWGYENSTSPNGTITNAEWKLDANEITTEPNGPITIEGNHTMQLRVKDSEGTWSEWVSINFSVYNSLTYNEDFLTINNMNINTTADWLNKKLPYKPVQGQVLSKIVHNGFVGDDIIYDIIQDSESNYIAVGITTSDLTSIGGSPNAGGSDFLVMKFDSNYNLIKAINFGGTLSDEFYNVIEDSQGNYVAVGFARSDMTPYGSSQTIKGNADFVIAKFDRNLNILDIETKGSNNNEAYFDLVENPDGGYFAVGYSFGSFNLTYKITGGVSNRGGNDMVIMKYNQDLSVNSIKNFGGTSDELINKVTKTNDGNFVALAEGKSNLTSTYSSIGATANKGLNDWIIVKFDKNLNLLRLVDIGTSGEEGDGGVMSDTDGTILFAGRSTGNLTGISNGTTNQGDYDLVIARLDTNLGLLNLRNWGSAMYDSIGNMTIGSDNLIYASGTSRGSLPTIGSTQNNGGSDNILVSFDNDLNIVDTSHYGGTTDESLGAIIKNSNGRIVLAGHSMSDLTHLGGITNKGAKDYVIAEYTKTNSYDLNKNILQSNEIDISWIVDRVLVTLDVTTPIGTSVDFYISIDGTNWIFVPKTSLNGDVDIILPSPSNTIYWKTVLKGTHTVSPTVNQIRIYRR